MHAQQTTLMEQILLNNINHALDLNNPSFISLVKIAKEQQLFFPELYTTFFTTGLHISFFWEYDYVLENYEYFSLDLKSAGYIYSDIWLFQSPILNQNINSYQTAIEKKLESCLKNGFILPEHFFIHYFVMTIFNEEQIKQFKRINRNNLNRYNKLNNVDNDPTVSNASD